MSTNCMPVPEGNGLPAKVAVVPEGLELDTRGIDKACRKLGLYTVEADQLAATHTLGKALKQVGALKVGRTILYSAAMHAQSAIEACDRILDATADSELAANVLGVKQKLIGAQADVGSKFIRSVEVDGSDDAAPSRVRTMGMGAAAGPVVIAQQAVVNTQKPTL